MAKVMGHITFNGTIDRVCFYMMEGKCYVRRASSLTGKRVKKDKRFQLTMVYAGLLARASRIGSRVYQELPKTFRQYWMFKAFTGEAIAWLKKGKSDEEATAILLKTYAEVWKNKEEVIEKRVPPTKEKVTIKLQKTIRVAAIPFIIPPVVNRTYSRLQYYRYRKHAHSPPDKMWN